jgi:GNAT superfamily N-acetyltransferase
MSLRRARPEDMAAVAEVWYAAWRVGHVGHVPEGLTTARTLEAFHDRTPPRVADTTVAEVGGEVAGFVMIAGDEVEQVFVDPPHHGSGIAAPLLAEAERQVAAAGHDVAWLAVVVGNARARRFYEKHGWHDAGDLPYEVTAGGTRYVSPCRRYEKQVRG